MSKASEHTSGSSAHEESKGEARRGESALIEQYAEFASFVVHTASRGSQAVVAANTTLFLGGIEALANSAEAWSHTYRRAELNPEVARSGENIAVDLTAIWNASLEISKKWVTDVTKAWTQAASVYAQAFEPKGK